MQLKVLNKVCEEDLNVKETEKIVSKVLDDILVEAKKEREKSKKMALKDVRIFDNTIKKAVGVMQKNGVDAVFMHNEDDMFYEYVIRIPKNDKQKSNIFEAI